MVSGYASFVSVYGLKSDLLRSFRSWITVLTASAHLVPTFKANLGSSATTARAIAELDRLEADQLQITGEHPAILKVQKLR